MDMRRIWAMIGEAMLAGIKYQLIVFIKKLMPLFVVVLAYVLAPVVLGVTPLTASQFVLAIDALDASMKATLITAAITVAGFITAFNTAHSSWKAERLTSLKLDAAEQLDCFFQESQNLFIVLSIYAEAAKIIADTRTRPKLHRDLQREIHILNGRANGAFLARQRLMELGSRVYTLQAKHRILCKMVPHADESVAKAVAYFQQQSNAMWFDIPAPSLTLVQVEAIIISADVDRLDRYLALSPSRGIEMIGAIGAARGALQADIVKPGIVMGIWSLLKLRELGKSID